MPIVRIFVILYFVCFFAEMPPAVAEVKGNLLEEKVDYLVGGGDVLDIRVFQEDSLTRLVRVNTDGYMPYPLIGKVYVLNMTPPQIADTLTKLLAKDFLVNPQVSVSVKEYMSKQVQVLGAVKTPGIYTLTGISTLTTMLSKSGGLDTNAGGTLLLLRGTDSLLEKSDKNEKSILKRIDLHALLEGGKSEFDLQVLSGDTLFVPKMNSVYVMGEVTQPGAISYQDGMTLLQAISKAGAFKNTASLSRLQIIRRVGGKEEILKVDGKKVQDGKEKDIPLQAEDLITVPRSIF